MNINLASDGFAAMGSASRLEVLRTLVRAGEAGLPVGSIQERTGIPASTLTHHIKFLTMAGLVSQERQGRTILCRAEYDHLRQLAGFILQECCIDSSNPENANINMRDAS